MFCRPIPRRSKKRKANSPFAHLHRPKFIGFDSGNFRLCVGEHMDATGTMGADPHDPKAFAEFLAPRAARTASGVPGRA
jgi:hypothetical protein